MKTGTKLIGVAAAAALAAAVSTYAVTASSQEGPPFMHRPGTPMMGMGGGMMGMGHDSATMAQMQVIHQLIVNHDRITRAVTNLSDGIRTVTQSDDPQIAQLIKEHVGSMGQRVAEGSDPGLPIESPALHAIFRDKDKIRTSVEATAKGIIVVQTSSDAKTVTALQRHALEVSDLVDGGMAAVHVAMAKNGGMMPGSMHGGMMPDTPNGRPAPDLR